MENKVRGVSNYFLVKHPDKNCFWDIRVKSDSAARAKELVNKCFTNSFVDLPTIKPENGFHSNAHMGSMKWFGS